MCAQAYSLHRVTLQRRNSAPRRRKRPPPQLSHLFSPRQDLFHQIQGCHNRGNPKQPNGVAEIKNRHLVEPLVAVMSEYQLPKYLWGYLLGGINYTMNRLYASKIDMSPYKALYGRKPDLSNLRLLGCQLWFLIPALMPELTVYLFIISRMAWVTLQLQYKTPTKN